VLQDYFSVPFKGADDVDRAQNIELFDNIEDVLNSVATEELMQKMNFNVVKGYLQRRPCRISPPNTYSPLLLEMRTFLFATHWW
jgi:hypothetical protein